LSWNVQLRHDAKETTWENHGYVTIKYTPEATGEEVTLCHSDHVQHNRTGRNNRNKELINMVAKAKKVIEGLTSAKATKIMSTAMCHTLAQNTTSAANAESKSKLDDGKEKTSSTLSLDAKM
jgi:hypothetical protein